MANQRAARRARALRSKHRADTCGLFAKVPRKFPSVWHNRRWDGAEGFQETSDETQAACNASGKAEAEHLRGVHAPGPAILKTRAGRRASLIGAFEELPARMGRLDMRDLPMAVQYFIALGAGRCCDLGPAAARSAPAGPRAVPAGFRRAARARGCGLSRTVFRGCNCGRTRHLVLRHPAPRHLLVRDDGVCRLAGDLHLYGGLRGGYDAAVDAPAPARKADAGGGCRAARSVASHAGQHRRRRDHDGRARSR